VKQVDGLFTTLFIIALHKVIREIDQRETIFNKLSQICAYADDVVLITKTKRKIIHMFDRLETEARKIGLLVNERKTKYMFMTAIGNMRKPHNLRIGSKEFEGVSDFKYLGNIIENNNRYDRCIKERLQAGNKVYYAKLQMLKIKIISRRSKLQIYKTLIRPVVTYGAEKWTLTTAEENALRRFERRVLRKIYGPVVDKGVWRIRYNEELCKLIGGEDRVRFIKAQGIQWLGHVERMDKTAVPKRVLKGKLYATRRIGRPISFCFPGSNPA
jgi:hypothetical protein